MLGLLAFDWNAWMGSRMDHFAEIDKNQKQTLNTGTSLIYAVCIDAIEFQLFEGSEYHNKYNWSYWFINKSIFFDVLIKTLYSFKFKFSRVRLDKHIHWQDFKRSMLKKPKLVIFKVSYYHNHFQWRLRLLNYTLSFTIDKIFWASLPILLKRHAQRDQSDIQARMNEPKCFGSIRESRSKRTALKTGFHIILLLKHQF